MIHRVLVVQTNFDTKALFYILLYGLLCEQKYVKPLIKSPWAFTVTREFCNSWAFTKPYATCFTEYYGQSGRNVYTFWTEDINCFQDT